MSPVLFAIIQAVIVALSILLGFLIGLSRGVRIAQRLIASRFDPSPHVAAAAGDQPF